MNESLRTEYCIWEYFTYFVICLQNLRIFTLWFGLAVCRTSASYFIYQEAHYRVCKPCNHSSWVTKSIYLATDYFFDSLLMRQGSCIKRNFTPNIWIIFYFYSIMTTYNPEYIQLIIHVIVLQELGTDIIFSVLQIYCVSTISLINSV